jgi:hypothetical protein
LCYNWSAFLHNVGDLDERKTEFYGEVYQIRQKMSTCDYELHFTDKDSAEQNGVNGAGIQDIYVKKCSFVAGNIDIIHRQIFSLFTKAF